MKAVIARHALLGAGWLAQQPETFQAQVLERSQLVRFAAGDTVYRHGDPLGGIYGLVEGTVVVTSGPLSVGPRFVHVGTPGFWIGEGPFLSRQPRRVNVQAIATTWMMHLPLAAMDQMAADDPEVWRRFVQIVMINLDTLLRAYYDLQNPDEFRRVALALLRVNPAGDRPIPITQLQLGTMANVSRKQVNAALRHFAALGWIDKGYRAVAVRNAAALRSYAEHDDA